MQILEIATAGVIAGGIGLVVGWFLKTKYGTKLVVANNGDLSEPVIATDGEFKMVLVVRNDLKMGKGKAAAQCAHAAVGCCENALQTHQEALSYWRHHGQPKVVVKVEDGPTLMALYKKAMNSGLPCCVISDAGRTQIPSGSKTVLGVGPGPACLVDEITGHLKLY
ncbi:hypothetical protein LOTGIDRAFT_149249 [Lottia gigantea]|uniref:peptidyl-tRNA hydrolase n=1 Tax=Lottia gigantea TaxID=225164 RepID=V4AST9_LOTGI|nr:hypothetical protein LOTGIDRAFT_149249 [Lottia gigantea]ESO97920.1 hypothetical protein LOTGIDRAFT_149249 [Lottia gigantea]